MEAEPFLKSRLTGRIFDGGVIPLEVLEDLSVLAVMLVEVAKWKYREDHPGRKRVPRGFTDGVVLKLASLESGSAVPVIILVAANTLFAASAQMYFDKARGAIISAIGAAGDGRVVTNYLPQKLLGYFDRLGRNLIADEAIEFTEGLTGTSARLTQDTRRTLVLASEAGEVTSEVVVNGVIPEVDQQANTFQIRLADGTKFKIPLSPPHFETIMDAFNGYKNSVLTRIHGSGRFGLTNRLQGIDAVRHISILDPLDVTTRIDELKSLRPGWLDGRGLVPDAADLDWFATEYEQRLPDDLPLPHLYPTPEGEIRAEWTIEKRELSLTIEFEGRHGEWHSLDLETDAEYTEVVELAAGEGWGRLADLLRAAGGANN